MKSRGEIPPVPKKRKSAASAQKGNDSKQQRVTGSEPCPSVTPAKESSLPPAEGDAESSSNGGPQGGKEVAVLVSKPTTERARTRSMDLVPAQTPTPAVVKGKGVAPYKGLARKPRKGGASRPVTIETSLNDESIEEVAFGMGTSVPIGGDVEGESLGFEEMHRFPIGSSALDRTAQSRVASEWFGNVLLADAERLNELSLDQLEANLIHSVVDTHLYATRAVRVIRGLSVKEKTRVAEEAERASSARLAETLKHVEGELGKKMAELEAAGLTISGLTAEVEVQKAQAAKDVAFAEELGLRLTDRAEEISSLEEKVRVLQTALGEKEASLQAAVQEAADVARAEKEAREAVLKAGEEAVTHYLQSDVFRQKMEENGNAAIDRFVESSTDYAEMVDEERSRTWAFAMDQVEKLLARHGLNVDIVQELHLGASAP